MPTRGDGQGDRALHVAERRHAGRRRQPAQGVVHDRGSTCPLAPDDEKLFRERTCDYRLGGRLFDMDGAVAMHKRSEAEREAELKRLLPGCCEIDC